MTRWTTPHAASDADAASASAVAVPPPLFQRRLATRSPFLLASLSLLFFLLASLSRPVHGSDAYPCAVCTEFVSHALGGHMLDLGLNAQLERDEAGKWTRPLLVSSLPTPEEFCRSAAHEDIARAHLYADLESQSELSRLEDLHADEAGQGDASGFDPAQWFNRRKLLGIDDEDGHKSAAMMLDDESQPFGFNFSGLFAAALSEQSSSAWVRASIASMDSESALAPLWRMLEDMERNREVDSEWGMGAQIALELQRAVRESGQDGWRSKLRNLNSGTTTHDDPRSREAEDAPGGGAATAVSPMPHPVPPYSIEYAETRPRPTCLVYEFGYCQRWDDGEGAEIDGTGGGADGGDGSGDGALQSVSLGNFFSKAFIQHDAERLARVDKLNRARKDALRLGLLSAAQVERERSAEEEILRKRLLQSSQSGSVPPSASSAGRRVPELPLRLAPQFRKYEQCVALVKELRAHTLLPRLAAGGCTFRNHTRIASFPRADTPGNTLDASADPWVEQREAAQRGGYSWPCPPPAACGCMLREKDGQPFCEARPQTQQPSPLRPVALECMAAEFVPSIAPGAQPYVPKLVRQLSKDLTPDESRAIAAARLMLEGETLPRTGQLVPSPTLDLRVLPPFAYPRSHGVFARAGYWSHVQDLASLLGILPITRDVSGRGDWRSEEREENKRRLEAELAKLDLSKLGGGKGNGNGGAGGGAGAGGAGAGAGGAAAGGAGAGGAGDNGAGGAGAGNGGAGGGAGGAGGGGNKPVDWKTAGVNWPQKNCTDLALRNITDAGCLARAAAEAAARNSTAGGPRGLIGPLDDPIPHRDVGLQEGYNKAYQDLKEQIARTKKGDEKDMADVVKMIHLATEQPTIDSKSCLKLIALAAARIALGIPQKSHGELAPPPVLAATLAKAAALTAKTAAQIAKECALAALKVLLQSLAPAITGKTGEGAPGPFAALLHVDVGAHVRGDMPFAPISLAAQTHCGAHLPVVVHNQQMQEICKTHDKCYKTCPGKKPECDKALVDAMVPLVCEQPEGEGEKCKDQAKSYYEKINELSEPRFVRLQNEHGCPMPPSQWQPPKESA